MSNRLKFVSLPEETASDRKLGRPSGGVGGFLRAYGIQLRGRRRMFLGTVAGLWCIAAAVILALPASYTGVATIMIGGAAERHADGTASGEAAASVDSEIEVIRSRGLAERVVRQIRLYDDAELNPMIEDGEHGPITKTIRRLFGTLGDLDGLTEKERLDRVRHVIVDRFLDRLDVARRGRSRAVEISYRSHSPERAATVANAVAEAYVAKRTDATLDAKYRATEWMFRRLSDLRRKVETSEQAVEDMRERASDKDENDQTPRTRRIEALRAEIAEIRARRGRVEARLNRTEALLETADTRTVAAALSSPALRALREQDSLLRRRAMRIVAASGDRDPRLTEIRQELQRIGNAMRAENQRVIQGLRDEIKIAVAKENSLRVALTRIENESAGRSPASARMASLKQEADANRVLYETLLTKLEDTGAKTELGRPDVRVLSHAKIPFAPSSPPTIGYLALALILACAAGMGAVGVSTRRERGFRSLQQIEQDTGMATLGLVPRIPKRGLRGMNPPDYILENPVSAYSESIRSLYTGILLSNMEKPPKVLMVASAAPNEGKTSLALSFARMVGRIGQKKVVLVDCDSRHPRVHHKLGLRASPGLVEYLTAEATLEEILQVDEKTNALVIAAGRKPSNSVELLTSERFSDLLSKLAEACDLVILDSPPVLAISDARILARLVDKTIFVAQWAKTRRQLVLRGVKELADAGADLAGIALTQVDVRRHARFGFGDSGIYHGEFRKYYSG